MIKIFDGEFSVESVLNRQIQSYGEFEQSVKQIIADVVKNKDKAVLSYTKKFDGVNLNSLEVSAEEIEQAKQSVSADFLAILKESAENIKFFHEKQIKRGFEVTKDDGVVLGQKYTPIEKAGIYVPGGTASYPSTVLMNAIPAKIAGVGEIVMCTPQIGRASCRERVSLCV